MKILYLSDTDLDESSGVAKKILMQANQWKKLGYHVEILSWDSLSWFSLDGERLTKPKIFVKRRGWRVLPHLYLTTLKIIKELKNKHFDVIYMRYRLYSPFFSIIKRHGKIVVEINTNDKEEFKKSFFLHLYNSLFRNLFLKNIDGFVCVSNELQKIFSAHKKPIAVIANGIDVEQYEFLEKTNNNKPNLVFIGSPNQRWHGVEKIEYLASKIPEFNFHFIGIEKENKENLRYYGYLNDLEARKIVAKMDVGISTLSLYLNNMQEASPLKSRQYLAQGLPIIYAYEDTDIVDEYRFCMKLPNTPNNVASNIDKIKAFVYKVFQNSACRLEARRFAKTHLDMAIKEQKRLEFFRKIGNES